jgi:competence protein ComEA
MGRRHTVDEETAAIATERLARLMADLRPRRAMPELGDDSDPDVEISAPTSSSSSSSSSSPPLPSARTPPMVAESVAARARTFGRRHVAVLTVVLLIGLGAGGWTLLRARPVADAAPLELSTTAEPVSPPASAESDSSGRPSPSGTAVTAGPTARPTTGSTAGPTAGAATILVHVVGGVRKPGVVTLPERARVLDAIEAAGGLARDARPGQLNLAQVVQDAQQVVIGTARHPGSEVRDGSRSPGSSAEGSTSGGGSGSTSDGSARGSVDLNMATVAELDTLPGVGPVTAQRILAWRAEHGRFSRVEELQEVDGIGPKTYARLAPHVRV